MVEIGGGHRFQIRVLREGKWQGDVAEGEEADNFVEFGYNDFWELQRLRGLPFQGLRRQIPGGLDELNCRSHHGQPSV